MGEADAIRELAERLLSPPAPDGPHHVRLLAGRLPEDVALPIPGDARLLGSLVREPGYQTDRDIEVVLDAPGNEEQLLGFFDESLGRGGWKASPDFMPRGGGFSAFPVGQGRMFRREGEGLALFVNVQPSMPGWTEVRIRSQWLPEPDPDEFRPRPYGHDVLPPLRPPAGVALQDLGSSGGGSGWTSNAAVETTQTVAELEAHFAGQLAKAGWNRVSGAVAGGLAVSTWTVPGKRERTGYLLVLEAPGKDRRSLWLRIESPVGQFWGGWRASTSSLRRG